MPVRVVPVPALEDNYMYVVIDEETKQCGVVDPVDASAIQTRPNARARRSPQY